MFQITTNVKFEGFKPVKPNAVKWSRSQLNYSDTATVKLPSITFMRTTGDLYEKVETGLQFQPGQKVTIELGYDGRNRQRFMGFIRRINFTVPVEIECEGYAYLLRKRLDFTRSYVNTTVKKILSDVTQGLDILLSDDIPEIPIPKAVFKNCTGLQVLDFLKEKCLLTVYFSGNVLFAGLAQLVPKSTVKYRLGWNVIKDDELKFDEKKEFADVQIKIIKRGKDGRVRTSFYGPKNGQVVEKKIQLIDDPDTLKKIAEEEKRKLTNRGYGGSITTFLEPYIEPGMSALIDDKKYPDRKGLYYITGEDGELSTSGGRIKVKIGNTLGSG